MTRPWLTIIGMGEDGPEGLTDASRQALAQARLVFGGARHLALAKIGDRGRPWPVPFDISQVLACKPDPVVVLASGDPFWFGVGGTLTAHLAPEEWQVFPAAGCFSLAAARLGWRLETTRCMGLHAAEFARLRPFLARKCRILATLRDGATPARLADWLVTQGMGRMELAVLERLGGPSERIRWTRADRFDLTDIQAPVAVALRGDHLPRGEGLPNAPGRPDEYFTQDGQITRAPIRAISLAALAPRPGELLWDIGGGSGAISVEWALAGGRAICIEPREDRTDNIRQNIASFGLCDAINCLQGAAPAALEGLPEPDAVFVGGGASAALLDMLWGLMPAGARLVCNAVTLETEALLIAHHADLGGDLTRIQLSAVAPLGRMRGWQTARAVTQWSVTR
ncbi:precorrin-6y C5,15-methyltransferase (decarboxylating) subunit CbiE [Paracoccus seriniphilus]|uniref:Precorrin-6Y C5,15-methyltransferase (Decarboxylating) n=1 Tax=Paracoccus seriniphilus TaxID=184748 RepID=A0A239PN28_9RHOB|nr:precorrin-6y C5,15-methyltransferase (decarboxylating) subunit CbiE [Paracoccus seriniphilus]WCR13827.1 precorrin-6y C5,15-methyltransferase (decarboxylating) subunit CbiE [Paracoccus seriniphilus]SNT68554.1 precorrin-6Y C5,15-methyltransferase (decarboxylating) [Paracoccus seriniphilus]